MGKSGTVWRLLPCPLQPVGGRGPWSSSDWDLQLNPQSNCHWGSWQLPLPVAFCLGWLFWSFSPHRAFAHSSYPCLSSLSLGFPARCALPSSLLPRNSLWFLQVERRPWPWPNWGILHTHCIPPGRACSALAVLSSHRQEG